MVERIRMGLHVWRLVDDAFFRHYLHGDFSLLFHLTYPVGLENGIADILGARGIPRIFFINKEMRIVKRHSNRISFAELEDGIQTILADPPPATGL